MSKPTGEKDVSLWTCPSIIIVVLGFLLLYTQWPKLTHAVHSLVANHYYPQLASQ